MFWKIALKIHAKVIQNMIFVNKGQRNGWFRGYCVGATLFMSQAPQQPQRLRVLLCPGLCGVWCIIVLYLWWREYSVEQFFMSTYFDSCNMQWCFAFLVTFQDYCRDISNWFLLCGFWIFCNSSRKLSFRPWKTGKIKNTKKDIGYWKYDTFYTQLHHFSVCLNSLCIRL